METTEIGVSYFKTPDEYLAAEHVAETKHEYLAGAIYAMAGTTADHNRIAANICRELGVQLRGKRCEVFGSDIKVRIRQDIGEFYYYPDVTIDCAGVRGDSLFAGEPRVIFEVLSQQTERIDRGEKLYNYQTLPFLASYVLVDQRQIVLTIYRRGAGEWKMDLLRGKSDILRLPEIECTLPLTAIYERTSLLR